MSIALFKAMDVADDDIGSLALVMGGLEETSEDRIIWELVRFVGTSPARQTPRAINSSTHQTSQPHLPPRDAGVLSTAHVCGDGLNSGAVVVWPISRSLQHPGLLRGSYGISLIFPSAAHRWCLWPLRPSPWNLKIFRFVRSDLLALGERHPSGQTTK